ncbi:MAG TPA: nucleotide exchange factor GrpE [bacterium]|nr:nucleotide exchange factor GrpE [bacterium]
MVRELGDEVKQDRDSSMSSVPASEQDTLLTDPETSDTEVNAVEDNDTIAVLEAATKKIAEYENQLARLQADFINFRRRVERERNKRLKFANEELLQKLLPVIDNLERAREAGRQAEPTSPLLEGIDQVLRQFMDLLDKEGVSPLNPGIGHPFDPKQQEVLIRDEGEEEVVVEELLRGWRYHDRVLRPTLVKIGPRPPENDDEGLQIGEPANIKEVEQ